MQLRQLQVFVKNTFWKNIFHECITIYVCVNNEGK